MFGIHPVFLIILLVVVLIIFGPGRLPELGGAIGKGIREFRKATNELQESIKTEPVEPLPTQRTTYTASDYAAPQQTVTHTTAEYVAPSVEHAAARPVDHEAPRV